LRSKLFLTTVAVGLSHLAATALAQSNLGANVPPQPYSSYREFGGDLLVRPPTRPPSNPGPYSPALVPEYSPRGVQAPGGFTVFPSVTAGAAYDSNVFALPSGAREDVVWTIAPELIGIQRGSRNVLALEAVSEILKYHRFTGLDTSNLSFGFGDAYEIAPDKFVSFGGGYEFLHLDPEREETAARSPSEFHVASAQFGIVQEAARFGYRVDTTVHHYDFLPLHPLAGGQIDQTENNYTVAQVAPVIFYQLTPNYTAFSRLSANINWYDKRRDSSGIRRDSWGGTLDFGVVINITQTLTGDVYVGALYQHYLDPGQGNQIGPDFGAGLTWSVSELTRVALNVDRSIEQTRSRALGTPQNFSATVTHATAAVDSLLYPNLLFHADVGLSQLEFSQPSRTDYEVGGRVEIRHYVNRYLHLGPEVAYVNELSSNAAARFDRLIAAFRVATQF
jgi:hypothetical protein